MRQQSSTTEAIHPDAVAKARASAPSDEVLRIVVSAFEALADPTRARILSALHLQPFCVRDLALIVGVSESAVSHQLRLLRDRKLVKFRREGGFTYYAIDDAHLANLLREAEFHADHVNQGLPDHE
jgi:DNA-binding transcriptional ArsR family regulator